MAGEAVKSTAITNADATPPVRATAGAGGCYNPVVFDGRCAVADAKDNTSTYRLARIPSNCYVKKVELWVDAANTTLAGDVGVYYSSNANDEVGASAGKTGVVTADADLFAAALDIHAIVTPTEYTFQSTEFTGADTFLPIWNVADSALTTDPGGFFDVVFKSTSTSSGAAVLNARITVAMPYTG